MNFVNRVPTEKEREKKEGDSIFNVRPCRNSKREKCFNYYEFKPQRSVGTYMYVLLLCSW